MIDMKKKSCLLLILLLAALPLLSACAQKAEWLPLFTPMPPGSTYAFSGEPVDGLPSEPTPDPDELFTSDVDSMSNPSIVVYKSRHILELYDKDELMARMRVAVGREEGAKHKSGDNKTPEGTYFICKKTEGSKYYKSLFFSYPNSDDAYSGLDNKLIDEDQYNAIVEATDRREQPPWDTKVGGEIAISGTGTAGKDKSGDWTAGNIALSDKDMDYLLKYVGLDVDVEIRP
jgi:hypothetical protein